MDDTTAYMVLRKSENEFRGTYTFTTYGFDDVPSFVYEVEMTILLSDHSITLRDGEISLIGTGLSWEGMASFAKAADEMFTGEERRVLELFLRMSEHLPLATFYRATEEEKQEAIALRRKVYGMAA